MQIEEMNDGRYVGLLTSEIMSFPLLSDESNPGAQLQQIAAAFANMLAEFHQISAGANTTAEIIWITEPVKQQAFLSRIRIFLAVRAIAAGPEETKAWLTHLSQSMQYSLEPLRYRLQTDCDDSLASLMQQVDSSYTLVMSKERRQTGATFYSMPYPYCKPLVLSPGDNFEALIQAISQSPSCVLSVQVIPAILDSNERMYYSAAAGEINALLRGAQMGNQWTDPALQEAADALQHTEQAADRMFLFQILIQGPQSHCVSVAGKVLSMLSPGSSGTLIPYDFSGEAGSLDKSILLYPWNISNQLIYGHQVQNVEISSLPAVCVRMPNLVTPSEMAAFFRLPVRTQYMAPLRESDKESGAEQFDAALLDPANIQVGSLLNRPDVSLGFPNKLFTKHMLIVGMPGSGKTTFCVHMLLQFAKKGIPFLAIEPTKAEYRAMIDAIPDLQIFTPGNNAVSPFIINPFMPPRGITVEKYIPSLFSAFHAAFSMPSPLDVIFLNAIRQCYLKYGWKDYSCAGDPDVTPFGIFEFILEFKRIVEEANYAKDVKGNLQSAGTFRLMNLIEQNSNIYDTVHSIPLDDLLRSPTVLELNAIDDIQQKALLMSLMLISICAYTKHHHAGDGKLKNVLLLDEAHVLLAPGDQSSDAQGAAVTRLQNMIVEIRSYGTAIFIADQSPSRVTREVVANTDIKVAFRLVQGVDRDLIADSCNMSERASLELSRLKPGQAYTYCSLLQSPQLVSTPDIREQDNIRLSVPDAEIADRMKYWQSHQELLRPFTLCGHCAECKHDCDMKIRARAEYFAGKMVFQYAPAIHDAATLQRYLMSTRKILGKNLEHFSPDQQSRLIHCTLIRFYRKMRMSSGISLSDSVLHSLLSREM